MSVDRCRVQSGRQIGMGTASYSGWSLTTTPMAIPLSAMRVHIQRGTKPIRSPPTGHAGDIAIDFDGHTNFLVFVPKFRCFCSIRHDVPGGRVSGTQVLPQFYLVSQEFESQW